MINTLPGDEEIIMEFLKPAMHCSRCMAILTDKNDSFFCKRCGTIYLKTSS